MANSFRGVPLSPDKYQWDKISREIHENDFQLMQEFLNWDIIAKERTLSEQTLRKFMSYMKPELVSQYQILSETFIRDFEDKLDWKAIQKYQVLSETFIRDFLHRLDTKSLCADQKISDQFVYDHFSSFDLFDLLNHFTFDSKVLDKIIVKFPEKFTDKVTWKRILQKQKLLPEFLEKYASHPSFSFCDAIKYQSLPNHFIDLNYKKIITSMLSEICLHLSSN